MKKVKAKNTVVKELEPVKIKVESQEIPVDTEAEEASIVQEEIKEKQEEKESRIS